MLLVFLFVYTASSVVSANPLLAPHNQCFCKQNFNPRGVPVFFETATDFDPYLQAASSQNSVAVFPPNHASSFNYNPANHVQANPYLNQGSTLVDPFSIPNQRFPALTDNDNSYNFNNGIPLSNGNRYNFNQGVPNFNNCFDLNRGLPADSTYGLNQGFSSAGNPFSFSQALPLVNTPRQGQTSEQLNSAILNYNQRKKISSKEKKTKNKNVKKALIESLLSNPTLKTLVDPKTKLYNQNGVEILRQVGSNSASTPNVINNYIIVPPELISESSFLKNNKRCKSKNHRRRNKDYGEEEPRKRKNRRKSDKKNDVMVIDPIKESSVEKHKSSRRKYKKKNAIKEINETVGIEASTLRNDINSSNFMKDLPVNENFRTNITPQNHVTANKTNTQINFQHNAAYPRLSNTDLNNYYNHDRIMNDYRNILNNKTVSNNLRNDPINHMYQQMFNKNSNVNKDNALQTKNRSVKSQDAVETANKGKAKQTATKPVNVNSFTKPQEEESIREICGKFPGIPEDLVKKLIAHLKKQLQNEQIQSIFPQWPFDFSDLQAQLHNPVIINSAPKKRNGSTVNRGKENKSRVNSNLNKTPRKNTSQVKEGNVSRRKNTVNQTISSKTNNNGNNREKQGNSNTTVEHIKENKTTLNILKEETIAKELKMDPKIVIEDKIEVKVPEKKLITIIDEIIETSSPRTYTIESNEIVNNAKNENVKINEKIPIYYGVIDDYYPDFRNDNDGLLFQDEEYAIKNIEFDRYHYTTDRSVDGSELSRERRKYEINYKVNNFNPTDKSTQSHKEDTLENIEFEKPETKETNSYQEPIEVTYITPPVLEVPDFQTKKIERTNFDERDYFDVNDKVSTYSDFKTTQPNDKLKPSKSNLDFKKHDVETVFARSRIAKYGPE